MYLIDLPTLKQDLQLYGQEILWKDSCWLTRKVKRFFSFEENRLYAITRLFKESIDALERTGISTVDPQDSYDALITFTINCRMQRCFVGQVQSRVAEWLTLAPSGRQFDKLLADVKRTLVSYRYRTEQLTKISKEDAEKSEGYRSLCASALEWKKKNVNYTQAQKELTPFDRRQLLKLARHPEYVATLTPQMLQETFKFIIRDGFSVGALVKWPVVAQQLYKIYLTSRLSGLHTATTSDLKCKRLFCSSAKKGQTPGVNVLVNGKFVNVVTQGEMLKEQFSAFKNKNSAPGAYEMFYEGIEKWNAHEDTMRCYKNGATDWYKKLPLLDLVPFSELKAHFPKLEKGNWMAVYETTREGGYRNTDNSHGYFVFYQPAEQEGLYRVWAFGKFANHWPDTLWEKIKFPGDTVEASWCYPDPNYAFYPQRQKASHPLYLKTEEEKKGFEKKMLETLNDPQLVFQWGGQNCAYEAEKLVLGKEPEIIKTAIMEVNYPPYMMPLFAPYKYAPRALKVLAIRIMIFLIGGTRSFRGKSLMQNGLIDTAEFYYPGRLHEKILSGEVDGYVHGGHNLT